MKITVVCDVYGHDSNGVSVAAKNLINYLKDKGHEVRVLCPEESLRGQENFFIVPKRNFYCFNGYVAKNGVTLAKPVKKIIEKAIDGVDIIHIMLPFKLGRAAARLAHKKGIAISAGFHFLAENFSIHLKMDHVYPLNYMCYTLYHKTYKLCDCIHYVSQFCRDLYERRYGKTNGYVISNGVNETFKPSGTEIDPTGIINILYTGRYSREKSHEVLFKAVRLSKYADRIQLICAGDGPLKEKFIKETADMKIPPIFNFYSREQIVEINRNSYLSVHAAEIEAEGIGCLEAISCGTVPIISNSKKSATKYYALCNESLFKCNDSKDLAAKIDWWIEHPDKRNEYSKRYAESALKNFDHEDCMKRMEEMLEKTIKEHYEIGRAHV